MPLVDVDKIIKEQTDLFSAENPDLALDEGDIQVITKLTKLVLEDSFQSFHVMLVANCLTIYLEEFYSAVVEKFQDPKAKDEILSQLKEHIDFYKEIEGLKTDE